MKLTKEVASLQPHPKQEDLFLFIIIFFQLKQAESQNLALTTAHNKSSSVLRLPGEASGWLSWT